MKPYVIRFGLYSGITLVILGLINWFVIAPWLGYRLSEVFGYLSFIVALLAVPVAIKYFREKLNDGLVSFASGFKIGLGVSLITSVVMFFYSFLFFVLVGDEFFQHYIESVPPEELAEIQKQYAEMPEFFAEPWFQGILMGVTVLLIGMIISIVSALFLKKTQAPAA